MAIGLAAMGVLAISGPAPAQEAAPRPVDEIVKDLGANFGKGREEAARELAALGPAAAKAVPDLKRNLADSYEPARVWAAVALARIDRSVPDGVPVLLKALKSAKGELHIPAVEALSCYDAKAPEVPEALLAALSDHALVPFAIRGLAGMGEAVLPLVAKALEPPDPASANALFEVAASMGTPAIPVILVLLGHPSASLRGKATRLLARRLRERYPAPVPEVLTALEDPATDDAGVQSATERAIAAGPAAVPGLAGLLGVGQDPVPKVRAAKALGRIGPAAKGAVPALEFLAGEFTVPVRDAALAALRAIVPELPPGIPFRPSPARLSGIFAGRANREKLAHAEGMFAVTGNAVDAALEWLARHQDPNGSWDCDGFESMCKKNKCGGPGGPLYDPGVTGLSLLAFLAQGETYRTPRFGQRVHRGLEWLLSFQDAEGCFGSRTISGFVYGHALATMAVCEATGMEDSPDLPRRAQDGVNFILKCQNPYLGWRYGVRPQDNDTSVTAWMVLALRVARESGLDLDKAAFGGGKQVFEGAREWFKRVTDTESGRVGYTLHGSNHKHYMDSGGPDKFPPDAVEGTTAQGIFSGILCEDAKNGELAKKEAALCLKSLPNWDESTGSIDYHYWHFGSLAFFQRGGTEWKKWREAVVPTIVDHQRMDKADDRYGSWDPVDPWSFAGGRIYATAINCLTLQTPYRYPRLKK